MLRSRASWSWVGCWQRLDKQQVTRAWGRIPEHFLIQAPRRETALFGYFDHSSTRTSSVLFRFASKSLISVFLFS